MVPNTDQRGVARPGYANGIVDIGACEIPVLQTATTYTVSLTSDTGAFNGASASTATSGDILWAVTQANLNTNPAGSVITFDPTVFNSSSPQTITLTATLGLSEMPWTEAIQGPGAGALTISGNHLVQVFSIGSGVTATISDVTISGGSGGGISNDGVLTITGCTVADNANAFGGGVANRGLLTLNNSTIEDNVGILGAGLFNSSNWPAVLNDCTIEGNNGSGVFNSGYMTVANSTIDDNSKGGIFLGTGALTLTNATITGNSDAGVKAYGSSGYYFSASSLRINDCTISGNSGGGIYVPASAVAVTLDNSIVAQNTYGGHDDFQINPFDTLVAYNNVIGADASGDLTNGIDGNIVGTPTVPIDPLLGPLQNNGGPTETMALLPGSPAIATGNVALAVDANGSPLTTDRAARDIRGSSMEP